MKIINDLICHPVSLITLTLTGIFTTEYVMYSLDKRRADKAASKGTDYTNSYRGIFMNYTIDRQAKK